MILKTFFIIIIKKKRECQHLYLFSQFLFTIIYDFYLFIDFSRALCQLAGSEVKLKS